MNGKYVIEHHILKVVFTNTKKKNKETRNEKKGAVMATSDLPTINNFIVFFSFVSVYYSGPMIAVAILYDFRFRRAAFEKICFDL